MGSVWVAPSWDCRRGLRVGGCRLSSPAAAAAEVMPRCANSGTISCSCFSSCCSSALAAGGDGNEDGGDSTFSTCSSRGDLVMNCGQLLWRTKSSHLESLRSGDDRPGAGRLARSLSVVPNDSFGGNGVLGETARPRLGAFRNLLRGPRGGLVAEALLLSHMIRIFCLTPLLRLPFLFPFFSCRCLMDRALN